MSVEGNKIICDWHNALPVVLVVPDVSPRFVTPARIRAYVHTHGWTTRRGDDFCTELLQLVRRTHPIGVLIEEA